jgi:hypothetical protein
MFGGTTGVYFEPGETVLLRIFTTDNATCTVAGHTVDITP